MKSAPQFHCFIAISCLLAMPAIGQEVPATGRDDAIKKGEMTQTARELAAIENARNLPKDKKLDLLMSHIWGKEPEVKDKALAMIRETEGWDDYIGARLEVLMWKVPEKGFPSPARTKELRRITETLLAIGDPKAVRFLIEGINDPTPGRVELDIQTLPVAQAAVERVMFAMSRNGGNLAIPNAPKSHDVKEWQRWWEANKDTYLPKAKKELPLPAPAPANPAAQETAPTK